MASITVGNGTKDRFLEQMPEDCDTHDEFVQELLAAYRAMNGRPPDPEAVASEMFMKVESEIELAVYRAVADFHGDDDVRPPADW